MTAVAGAPVLVGVDGSRRGLDAVEAAAAEAALRHRSLRIVHAFAWPTPSTAVPPGVAGLSLQTFRDGAEEIVTEAVLLAGKVAPDVPTSSRVVNGGPSQVLCAESRHAALLVLGDRGTGGIPGLRIGSAALHAATHGACPVLVVRGNRAGDGPVVVGIDGSRASAAALGFAAEEAALRETELVALHAWNGDEPTELNDTLPMSYEAWAGEDEQWRVLAEALAGIAERHPDLPIRRHIIRGPANRLLVDCSRSAQLLVVGDRGHSTFAGLLLGSVSQHMIHHAACPTLVVRQDLHF